MNENTAPIQVTPDERLKNLILTLLEKATQYKINGEKEKFSNAVESLFHLSKKYLSKPIRNDLKEAYKKIKETIRMIEKEGISDVQKKTKIIELKYRFADEVVFPRIIENLFFSQLFKEFMVGRIIIENMEDIKRVSSELRKPITSEKILEVDTND